MGGVGKRECVKLIIEENPVSVEHSANRLCNTNIQVIFIISAEWVHRVCKIRN